MTTYYVQAKISSDGDFADCKYFYDKQGTERVEDSVLRITLGESGCSIEQTTTTSLALIGATYKTLGQVPAMNASNFCPADDSNAIFVTMPATTVTTKGVVLLFADMQTVTNLYPSSDPQVTNETP